jgi:hypothetical protein
MTKYPTKYLTKIYDYKGTRKNGQMKTTCLVEVVVCTPQAAQNDVIGAAGAAKMVFCVTNAATGAAKNHSLQLGSAAITA